MTNVIEFPKLELKKEITNNGLTVCIDVYNNGNEDWLLEIVDKNWNSTCWEEPFNSAQEAMNEGISAINEEGINSFIGQ